MKNITFASSLLGLTGVLFVASADDAGLAKSSIVSDEKKLDTVRVDGSYLYMDQVNALKTPTPIIDVPQSLSIVTADDIADRGFDSLGDLVLYTPGVSNSQGEGHRDAIVFRGVRSTADFFVDGVRDDVQYYRPLYNLEQVEILRGPNALLFGRGGTGGILNRVTKKAKIAEDFTAYQLNADSFGHFGAQIDSNFGLSDRSAFRINAMVESLDGHRDFYDGDRIAINPTAKFLLSPSTELDLSYEYIDYKHFIDRGIPTGSDGRPVEAFEDIVFGDPELNLAILEAHLVRASLQHKFSDQLKGNLSAFFADYDKSYNNLYASAYNQSASPDVVTLDGYIDTTQRQNFILSGNLIAESDFGGVGHTLILGAEYIDSQNDNDRYNTFWDQTSDDNEIFLITRPLQVRGGVGINASGAVTTNDYSVDLSDNTQASVEVFSAYVQDEIELSERLDLIIGLRFDSFDITVNNLKTPTASGSSTDEELSPRVGLVYKPIETMSVYGSYSESFLPRSGEQFDNINSDNALEANTYSNLEAGLKWDILERISLTTAVFEIEERSPQTADSDPSTLDVIETKTNGFELQVQGQLTDAWHASLGYTYLDGNQINPDGSTGNRKAELPEHMLSFWNSYQVSEKFGVGIGFTYQDDSFVNNANTAVLPSYTRFDAAAFYDVSETLRLQLNVENLTDELYFPTSHSTHQVTVGAPLNARLTISGRF